MGKEWRRLNTRQSLLPGGEILASFLASNAGRIPKHTHIVAIDLAKRPNRAKLGANLPPLLAPRNPHAKNDAAVEICRLYSVGKMQAWLILQTRPRRRLLTVNPTVKHKQRQYGPIAQSQRKIYTKRRKTTTG